MILDPPGPPQHLKSSDVRTTNASLSWEAPDFNGGSPVTGYYVEKKSGTRWIKVNKKPTADLAMVLADLIECENYEIQVSAENDAGVGNPSEPISFIAKDPFDAPGQPDCPTVIDISPEEASLVWSPSADDGGTPITNYIVEIKPNGEFKWKKATKVTVTEPKYTVKGLQEGVEYEFRVTAENNVGAGAPSKSASAKYGENILIKQLLYFTLNIDIRT